MKTKINHRSLKGAVAALMAVSVLAVSGTAQAQSKSAPIQSVSAVSKDVPINEKSQMPGKPEQVAQPAPAPESAAETNRTIFAAQPAPGLVTAGTYPFADASPATLEDMSSGTTQLIGANSDDGNSVAANIGFDYWFDGVRFTQFGANANGFIRLGAAPTGTSFTNSLATTTNAPKIAPYWDDLCTGSTGKVHFKVIGSAPNRKLVVEWQNMQITRGAGCGGVGNGTFQLWLFETSGLVEFVYGALQVPAVADGGFSTGMQSGAATNFASITSTGPTVSYVAANNAQSNAIAANTAYLFTPNVPAAPTGLNFTAVGAMFHDAQLDGRCDQRGWLCNLSVHRWHQLFLRDTNCRERRFASVQRSEP